MSHSALIHVITSAMYKASKPLLRDIGEIERLQVSRKGTANFVTNADVRTEQILVDELSRARKDWGFLTEEGMGEEKADCEHRFVIDPIDGTTNFIHAIPYICMSIAAQKRIADDAFETIAGVIYDPVHDEMFVAEKGMGAVMNNKKMRVSNREEDWLVSTTTPRLGRYDMSEVVATMDAVAKAGATVRCSGAAALDLAYVAAARYDGIWYHRLQPWDILAGELLVSEAGGKISQLRDANGEPIEGSILASNALIHDTLQSLVSGTAKAA